MSVQQVLQSMPPKGRLWRDKLGTSPLYIKLNDVYTHKHAGGDRESSTTAARDRFKSAVRPPTVNMLQLMNRVPRRHREEGASRPELSAQDKSQQVCLHPTLRCPPRQRHRWVWGGGEGGGKSPTLAPGLFTCCVGEIVQRGAYKCSGGCRGQVPCEVPPTSRQRMPPTLCHPAKLGIRRLDT